MIGDDSESISVPTTQRSGSPFKQLADLAHALETVQDEVALDWSGCHFFEAHYCAVLAGLLENRGIGPASVMMWQLRTGRKLTQSLLEIFVNARMHSRSHHPPSLRIDVARPQQPRPILNPSGSQTASTLPVCWRSSGDSPPEDPTAASN